MEMQNLNKNWINTGDHSGKHGKEFGGVHDSTPPRMMHSISNSVQEDSDQIIMKRFRGGVTVGEFSFIHKYSEENIKKVVKKVKELDKEFIKMMATDISHYILNDTHTIYSIYNSLCYSPKILLFHCPSTAFALGMKKADHMAEVLKMIHTLSLQKPFNKHRGVIIDLALHAFCISRTERVSQHTKSMRERLVSSQEKYMTVVPFSKTFKRILSQYDAIYILDDVVTTGSTLAVIREILAKAVGQDAVCRFVSIGYAH